MWDLWHDPPRLLGDFARNFTARAVAPHASMALRMDVGGAGAGAGAGAGVGAGAGADAHARMKHDDLETLSPSRTHRQAAGGRGAAAVRVSAGLLAARPWLNASLPVPVRVQLLLQVITSLPCNVRREGG